MYSNDSSHLRSPQRSPQRSHQLYPKRFSNFSRFYSPAEEEIENRIYDDDNVTILPNPRILPNPSPSRFGPNWSRHNSRRDGRPYYFNEATGRTQWEQPLNQEQTQEQIREQIAELNELIQFLNSLQGPDRIQFLNSLQGLDRT